MMPIDPKIVHLSRAAQKRREGEERTQRIENALLALVKSARVLRIPVGALADLVPGDGMTIEVTPNGYVLTYVHEGEEPDAG